MDEFSSAGVWFADLVGTHVIMLELMAVQLALEEFRLFLSQKSVLLCSDNMTVACYVNKQGGARSFTLSLKAESILLFCQ